MAKSSETPRTCPVLIGREDDLFAVRRAVDQAYNGRGGVVLVTGEAGIGKSRLVAGLRTLVGSDDCASMPTLLQGYCFEPDRLLPYAPLLDLLDSFLRSRPSPEVATLFDASAADVARLVPAITQIIPGLVTAPPLEPEQEKRRLFQVLAQFLLKLAEIAPLLVVIEDIHWCDDTSLDFFLYLTRRIEASRLLLILTFRSDEVYPPLAHFLALLERERLTTELTLQRLSAPQVEAMLSAIIGGGVRIRWDFTAMVYSLTEGNPFFIEEVMKSADISDHGVPPVAVVALPDAVQIPRSVKDAVHRRSTQLGEHARDLLRIAAVAGRRFDFAVLQAITGMDEMALLAGIKEMITAQLVVEESADHFAFRHALTHQAMYGELLTRERRLLHQTIAETIESVYAGALDAHFTELAYHFYEAQAWGRALWYTRRVGDRALALHSPRAAVEQFSRAIIAEQRLEMNPSPDLYRSRGMAYGIIGDFESARGDHTAALVFTRQRSDQRAEWRSLMDLGDLWAGRDYARSGEFFRQAAVLARDLDNTAIYARSLNRLANWLINTGQVIESFGAHQEALHIFANSGDRRGMAETFDLLGMAHGISGATVDSVEHYTRAIALFRELDEPQLLSSSLASQALYASPALSDVTYGVVGDPEAGERMVTEALLLARRAGWLAGEAYAHWAAAATCASYGAFGTALEHGTDALSIATEIEHQQWMAASYWSLGQTRVALLAPPAAISQLEAGLGLARMLGSAWWLAHLSASLAHAHLLNDDPQSAASVLEVALARREQPRIMPERRVAWMWGEVTLAQGDPVTALSICEALIGSTPGSPNGHVIPWLAKLRGEALIELNRFNEAEESLDAAIHAAERQHAQPLLWQLYRARGRMYHRCKRDLAAEQNYRQARNLVTMLGKTLNDDLERERFLTAALSTLPKERQRSMREITRAQYGGLTPREREVATQIALGNSNRAIAEALILSERTITTYVTSILGKLGFTSRVQVAAWAIAHGLADPDVQS